MSSEPNCLDYNQVNIFVSSDTNRIVGKIAEVLARRSPYIGILGGGTLPNVSTVVRSVIQERSFVASSLAAPVFVNDVSECGVLGGTDQVGTTEYQYQLQTLRGMGPQVCVKTARTAFKGGYLAAQVALEKGVLQIMNSDIRYQLQLQSGVKFVANSTLPFSQALTGDMQQINTLFNPTLPNSTCTFAVLQKLAVFLREEMLADPFEDDAMGTMYKAIFSEEQILQFKNELDVRLDHRAMVTGKYQLGERQIAGYSWEGPYRGVSFGVDAQPLRFNNFYTSGPLAGTPQFIEPEIGVSVTQGVGARRNPNWVTAQYEVGFLMAQDSFNRLTPEMYTGEGTFKFAPQLFMGELEWFYLRDRCNPYGDFGNHIYQIQRAYQPQRPQNVIPIIYQRCPYNFSYYLCATTGNAGL
jgi:hypothetical protein